MPAQPFGANGDQLGRLHVLQADQPEESEHKELMITMVVFVRALPDAQHKTIVIKVTMPADSRLNTIGTPSTWGAVRADRESSRPCGSPFESQSGIWMPKPATSVLSSSPS